MDTQAKVETVIQTVHFQIQLSNADMVPSGIPYTEVKAVDQNRESVPPFIHSQRPTVILTEVVDMLLNAQWPLQNPHWTVRKIERKGVLVNRHVVNYSFMPELTGKVATEQQTHDFQNLVLDYAFLTRVYANSNGVYSIVLSGPERLYDYDQPRMVRSKADRTEMVAFKNTLPQLGIDENGILALR